MPHAHQSAQCARAVPLAVQPARPAGNPGEWVPKTGPAPRARYRGPPQRPAAARFRVTKYPSWPCTAVHLLYCRSTSSYFNEPRRSSLPPLGKIRVTGGPSSPRQSLNARCNSTALFRESHSGHYDMADGVVTRTVYRALMRASSRLECLASAGKTATYGEDRYYYYYY